MPTFYLDIRDGKSFIEDARGEPHPDIEAARARAVAVLSELAREWLPGSSARVIAVEVRDDHGKQVARARLIFEATFV